jgi:peptidoglycan hydrolase-like protein with peptidoglycan-binding domain
MSRQRPRWIAATMVVVVVGGGSAAFVLANGEEAETPKETAPLATAQVTVADLVETMKLTGALGYADQTTLSVNKDGLITWLPKEKATLKRGDPVARVNNVQVLLFYGKIPFYRTLEYGVSDGPDVEQLKRNLGKLGLLPDGVTVDEEFTSGTRQAVKNLQDLLGVKETGTFDPNSVVVMPGAVLVGAPAEGVTVGSSASGPLYTVSTKEREVTTSLSPTKARLVEAEDQADVTLPDGKTTTATVTEIAAATTDEEGDVSIPITLTLDDPEGVEQGTGLPVSLTFVAEITEDATTVPVLALIALAEGGYAVEVMASDGTTTLVPVDPGTYADGLVEVDGDLNAGDEVVVPS